MSESAQPSFESLYSTYTPLVRRLLRQQGVSVSDLDDVLQETFATVHRLLPSFEGRSSVSTWLHAVTWRVAANHRRRQRRTIVGRLPDVAADPNVHEPELERERDSISLEHIESEQRDLLALREIGGLSISFLAELTGHARATVRNKIQLGRAALLRAGAVRSERAEAYDRELAAHFARTVPVAYAPDTRILSCGLTAVTTVDDLVLAVWRGPCSNAALDEVLGTLLMHARDRPAGIRYLSVVEPASKPPDRHGRDKMLWATRKLKGKLNAVAVVVEGAVRVAQLASIVNASVLVGRASFDPHYFGRLTPALAWLAQSGPTDGQQLTLQIARMKQQLDPKSS